MSATEWRQIPAVLFCILSGVISSSPTAVLHLRISDDVVVAAVKPPVKYA